MAEIKDKVVTVESLEALHDYNQKTYMPMNSPEGSGDLTIWGDGIFDGDVYVGGTTQEEGTKLVKSTDIIPIANGGTNASDGATGLKNLFASGATVLSTYQYGDTLPTAGTKGRIFFKKLT